MYEVNTIQGLGCHGLIYLLWQQWWWGSMRTGYLDMNEIIQETRCYTILEEVVDSSLHIWSSLRIQSGIIFISYGVLKDRVIFNTKKPKKTRVPEALQKSCLQTIWKIILWKSNKIKWNREQYNSIKVWTVKQKDPRINNYLKI